MAWHAHDRWFAATLLERADEALAGCMLALLKYSNKEASWRREFVDLCIGRGGEFAQGVLEYDRLQRGSWEADTVPITEGRANASQPMKLAWVWAYANTAGASPALSLQQLQQICDELEPWYAERAFYILGYQMDALPPLPGLVQEWLRSASSYQDWIAAGAKDNDSSRSESLGCRSRRLPGYPVRLAGFNPKPLTTIYLPPSGSDD
jgi:hypothetical protein